MSFLLVAPFAPVNLGLCAQWRSARGAEKASIADIQGLYRNS